MSKRDIEAIYPLTPQQAGMLLESLAVPGSAVHIEQMAVTLEGELDLGLFGEAWQRLLQRHPVLRTAFIWQDQEEPLQLVLRRVEMPIEHEDWSDVPDEETPARLAAFLEADGRRDFKPSKAPLMRVHLLRAGPALHHLVWTHHHILMDGWCRPLVLSELIETYGALTAGREPRLTPARPYRDYVKWLGERDPEASETFWRERLAGFTHPTPLGRPACAGTPRVGGHGGVKLRFGPEETRALESAARARHLTASTLAQGAWALALAWASGEEEVVFGVTVSGRPEELEGIEGSIGLFINTLPLRVEVPRGGGLLPWLEALQQKNLELRRHEHVSAGQVHRWSEVPGSLPLFESLLVFENYPADPADGAGDRPELPLTVRRTSAAGGRTRHPVTLMVGPGEQLGISLVHDRSRVPDAAAEALAGAFAALLRAIVEDPERDLPSVLESLDGKGPPEVFVRERGAREGRPVAPPRSSTEQMLAVLWGEVLGLSPVGIDEDFFRLGGHSMAAAELIAVVRRAFDLELPLRTLFEHPTIEALAAEIARRKGDQDRHAASVEALPTIVPDPDNRHEPFPLTDIQEAYWIGRSDTFELGNVATHLYSEWDVDGLDLERFELAWRRLVERHGMLRMTISSDGLQRIRPVGEPYEIAVLDLSDETPEATEARLTEIREEMSHQVLPADPGPLFEIRATRLPAGRTRIHSSFDLLIGDAWSWFILARELAWFQADPEAELPPLTLSFRDCVLAEKARAGTPLFERSRRYWLDRLPDLPPAPELPLARRPGSIRRPRFERLRRVMEPAVWKPLKARAARWGVTPSGLLLAAFSETVAAWARGPRFTLNLTLFNRPPLHPEIHRVVGDFTSLTLLEADPRPGEAFGAWARRLQQRFWDDLDHRWFSGVRVLRELGRLGGRPSGALMPVIFTSTLNLDPALLEAELPGPGAKADGDEEGGMDRVFSSGQTPQVWLDHQVSEVEGSLRFTWDVVGGLFPAGMVEAMFAAYLDLLERLADEETSWDEAVPVRPPASDLEVQAAANATEAPLPEGLLHEGFFARAAEDPERLAVVSGGRRMSYGELAARATALGRHLRDSGVAPGELVGVVMSKGWEQVVAVLGILAAGGAYLPVDAELPEERRRYLLEHGQARFAVTQARWVGELSWPDGVEPIAVAEEAPAPVPVQVPEPLAPVQAPDDLAYVIFTSGSTGRPKGVMIEHRAALNTVADVNRRFSLGPEDRVLGLSSLSFDLSVWDVFGTLAAGGALVLPEPEANRDPVRWLDLLETEGVSVWNTVPALLEMLVEYAEGAERRLPGSLRLALLSGDWIPLSLPERLWERAPDQVERRVEVVSLGGATEASIWSILFPVGSIDPEWRSIPYGRPMANQTFRVLGPDLAPQPLWAVGELWIGGAGLARGYWRDEEKTAAAFVEHPETGERLYRTGDLGRYRPDGTIEFLGREDSQVKIRGHRIELGEIEATLARHPAVREAVADVRETPGGERRLVAWAVLDPEGRAEILRTATGNGAGSSGIAALDKARRKLAQPALRKDLDAEGVDLPGEDLDDPAVIDAYVRRRSFRDFSTRKISLTELGELLGCLRQLRLDEAPLPKYRYASAGGLYPVQVYLAVREGRVEGVPGGVYYYHPVEHRLAQLSSAEGLRADAHGEINRAVFAASAFSLFLVGEMRAIVPAYGESARHFATLEAGAIAHLLETAAPAHHLGLCQIGGVDEAAVESLLGLGPDRVLLHSLLGGRIEADRLGLDGYLEEAAAYRTLFEAMLPAASGLGEPGEPVAPEAPAAARAGGRSASEEAVMAAALRSHLERSLPAPMVPTAFGVLDRLPLSANGKVDRAVLPDPGPGGSGPEKVGRAPFEAPRNEREEWIASLWREVLHLDEVGIHDNFFELGGHSVPMVRVYNELTRSLEGEIPLVALFEHPTISSLAAYLEGRGAEGPGNPALGERPAAEESAQRGEKRREAMERRRLRRAGGEESRG